jgi:hypothetical protein
MKNTTTNKKTGGLLMAMLLLLMACDKQGPMGPEGPPGPDGQNASTGGGSFITYLSEEGATWKWMGIDGWGGYAVANLAEFYLPDSAASKVDNGGVILVYLKMNNAWRRLPFSDGFNDVGEYNYYVNYGYSEGIVSCYIKAKDADSDEELEIYQVERVKIVVAPATSVVPLKL